jgi:hypothetical protein
MTIKGQSGVLILLEVKGLGGNPVRITPSPRVEQNQQSIITILS